MTVKELQALVYGGIRLDTTLQVQVIFWLIYGENAAQLPEYNDWVICLN